MGVYTRRARTAVLGAAVVLAIVAYWPFLHLPFISDDYVQIQLGRDYGPSSAWGSLLKDPLYRCRATAILVTNWTEAFFGLSRTPYAVISLVLHLINVGLVLLLGAWRPVGYGTSTTAAILFAVYEAPQEAVVWYSALPELFVFTFSISSLLCFLQAQRNGRSTGWLAASLGFFVMALFSKESAVVTVPLAALSLWADGALRTRWRMLIPFAALALLYTGFVFASASTHLHFNDAGTFSLNAPFPLVLVRSAVRVLWIWGALAILAIVLEGSRVSRCQAGIAVAWVGITLLPYSFLTYMPRVPSRHLYLAAAGASILFAAALHATRRNRLGRALAVAALIGFVAQNIVYLHTRKLRQYEERAAITEELLREAASASPPLYLSCFPYSPVVAQLALQVRLKRQVMLAVEEGTRDGLNLCTDAHFAQATKGKTIRMNW